MTKEFDAALKELFDANAPELARYLAARVGATAPNPEIIESDVSTITLQADKVFRLGGNQGLLHVELESSWAGAAPSRILFYNVLLDNRHGAPVQSVLVLLRPEANATSVTGRLRRDTPSRQMYLEFSYGVVRLWEESLDTLLGAGPGLLPLALLTNEAGVDLQAAFQRVEERLAQASLAAKRVSDLRSASYVLLGLRYDEAVINNLFRGVTAMKDSTTYQAILREGKELGAVTELHKVLLRQGRQKWGSASEETEGAIRGIQDLERLERMTDAVLPSNSWQELLATP